MFEEAVPSERWLLRVESIATMNEHRTRYGDEYSETQSSKTHKQLLRR
jgi:hypothetical protein